MPTTSLNSISRWRHPSQTKPPPPRGDAVLSLSSWWFSLWPDTLDDGDEQGKAVDEDEDGDAGGVPPSPIPVLGRGVARPDAAVSEPRSRQLQLSTRPEDDLLPTEARLHHTA